jgi:hypothetical protein
MVKILRPIVHKVGGYVCEVFYIIIMLKQKPYIADWFLFFLRNCICFKWLYEQ